MRSLFLMFALVVLLGSAATASFDLVANFPAFQGQNGLWVEAYNPSTSSFREMAVLGDRYFGIVGQAVPSAKYYAEGAKLSPSAVEWPTYSYKAAEAGNYTIQGCFSNANATGATTRGVVFKNGAVASPLFAGNVTSTTTAPFGFSVTLAKGDYLRFSVDPLGSNSYDNTWLNGVVSTPEPGSLMAFATGLIGFAGLTRRRFRK